MFHSGLILLEDILTENGGFKSVEEIIALLKFRNSKISAIFNYAKLHQAIPKIWLAQISNDKKRDVSRLTIPKLKVGETVKGLSDITSRYCYNHLIQQEGVIARFCFFWENNLKMNTKRKICFERNSLQVLKQIERI